MITRAMFGKVRRMYYREHLSISEIVRRTSLSRNTVKKWLRVPSGSEPRYQRIRVPGKLAPFECSRRPCLLWVVKANTAVVIVASASLHSAELESHAYDFLKQAHASARALRG